MNQLTAISLKNRALIALISLCAVIFGVIGAGALKQELFPSFELPQAVVSAQYEGASPEAVESEVTEPLEAALGGVEEVESVNSVSSTGSSQITVETSYGTNSDDVVRSLQRAVSQVESQLPDGVEPSVMSGSLADFPIIVMSVTGGDDTEQLAADLEDIAVPELRDIEGVREVQVTGDLPQEVAITVREDDLEDEGISVDQLASILQANGIPTSAGALETGEGSAPVEIGTRLTSVESIADIALTGPDGPVLVRDVADVELRDEAATSISRTDGKPSLTLAVTKKPDANTVDVSNGVLAALPEISDTMGGDVDFVTVFDQAPFIEQSVEDLVMEGALGLIFAVVVILVFLFSIRATIITAISIPLSLLITLIGLWLGGYTLNMLTLGALTISIGRVVDDSIVVIESIRRRHSLGGAKFANILAAVGEVAGAITASTLTSVAVFLPLVFVSGQTGELFRPFALTATIALLSSLFVALTIVPVLAYWFLRSRESRVKLTSEQKARAKENRKAALAEWKAERKKEKRRDVDVENPAGRHSTSELPIIGPGPRQEAAEVDELASLKSPVTRLQKTYLPVISFTTKHPVLTVLASALVLVATFAMTPLLKTELFGDTGEDSVQMTQTFAAGTDLDEAGRTAEPVEDVLANHPDVESYQLSIGGDMAFGSGGGATTGSYFVNLVPGTDTAAFTTDLQAQVDELEDVGEVEVLAGGTMPGGSTIDITLTANDPDELSAAAESLTGELDGLTEVQTVTTDLEAVQPVIEVDIDREEAADNGLSEAEVGSIVSRAMRGQELGSVVLDNVTHRVLLYDGSIESVEELRELEITVPASAAAAPAPEAPGPGAGPGTGPGGGAGAPGAPAAPAPEPETIELDEIADVNEIMTPPTITHSDGLRSVTVSVTPAGDDLGAASTAVTQGIEDADLPAAVSADIGGATAEQNESFRQLGLAMLAAVLIVFIILVATFKSLLQPVILLVSIPFAATGSIGLLLLTDTPLGLTAMIGLLMLIGIVVTNAIVLIDLINHFRARGVPLRTAVVHGSRLRYRPILMTAAATIFALVPMALGLTGGGVFISKPLAITVIGGLVSSTVLTLVLVPVLYQLLEGVKERRAERKAIRDMTRGEVIDEAEAAEDARREQERSERIRAEAAQSADSVNTDRVNGDAGGTGSAGAARSDAGEAGPGGAPGSAEPGPAAER
ncbi:efflux RND transporter permease subunit [Brevibacterium sp. R8603A2]|uniref:efflux RND transporter permease subunit n=1 Tax=Brevibacterium sp. R8603A2 TaxID=2929779 RepID=UPI001FF90136|nr:efflux RND transporter permease subunit [Brevibacterium sp. R8603A2]